MSDEGETTTVAFGPSDLVVCGSSCGRWLHVVLRDPRDGRLMPNAFCGATAWTEDELSAQLLYSPPFSMRQRCVAHCWQFWSWVDLARSSST